MGFQPGAEPIAQLTRRDAEALLAAGRAQRQALMSGGNVAHRARARGPRALPGRGALHVGGLLLDVRRSLRARRPVERSGRRRARARRRDLEGARGEAVRGRQRRGADDALRPARARHRRRARSLASDAALLRPVHGAVRTGRAGVRAVLDLARARARSLGQHRLLGRSRGAEPPASMRPAPGSSSGCSSTAEKRLARTATSWSATPKSSSRAGRFTRPPNVRLRNVMEWLDFQQVVPSDVRLQAWLAFGFLAVCLLNTVGLLLAKFLRRSQEIGVRRALGASRRAIFAQFLVEAGSVGLVGGVLRPGPRVAGLVGGAAAARRLRAARRARRRDARHHLRPRHRFGPARRTAAGLARRSDRARAPAQVAMRFIMEISAHPRRPAPSPHRGGAHRARDRAHLRDRLQRRLPHRRTARTACSARAASPRTSSCASR